MSHAIDILSKGGRRFAVLFLLCAAVESQEKQGEMGILHLLKNIAAGAVAVYNADRLLLLLTPPEVHYAASYPESRCCSV